MNFDHPIKTRKSYDVSGHAHELTFSCYHQRPLLREPEACQAFLSSVERARKELGFRVWAYVVMPEHVHVLVYPEGPDAKVARVLTAIKRPCARAVMDDWKLRRPDLVRDLQISSPSKGTFYRFWQQGGGYDRNVVSRDAFRATIEYLHQNPVRRGLVDDPLAYPWSSARDYAGLGHGLVNVDILEGVG